MAKGNYWEYQDSGLYVKTGISIVGDTIMTNGKPYSIFRIKDLLGNSIQYSYRRLESNSFLYIWRGNDEYKYYDFTQSEQNYWEVDLGRYRAFVKSDTCWLDLFQKNFLRKEYENQYRDSEGHQTFIEREWQQVCMGIGETLLGYSGGYIKLIGAIINGKQYGTITSVDKTIAIPKTYLLNQNYPNPFNSSTKISYSLPLAGYVTLSLHNVLGEIVTTLVSGYQSIGNYSINFNSNDLASGIYFIIFHTNDFTKSVKMFYSNKLVIILVNVSITRRSTRTSFFSAAFV